MAVKAGQRRPWRSLLQRGVDTAGDLADLVAQKISVAIDPRARLLRRRRRALRWGLVFTAGCLLWGLVTALLAAWGWFTSLLVITGTIAVTQAIPATLLLLRYRWLRSEQDFMYPSIGPNCVADGSNSIATALSVAGPAKIPLPGPGPGQTAYVFTAVGTPGPADVQRLPLNVTWVNLTTGKSGSATLRPRSDINPDGPTTLTVIADTGSGSIMSTIFGQVTTKDRQCQFMPTIGSTVVP